MRKADASRIDVHIPDIDQTHARMPALCACMQPSQHALFNGQAKLCQEVAQEQNFAFLASNPTPHAATSTLTRNCALLSCVLCAFALRVEALKTKTAGTPPAPTDGNGQ